MLAKSAVHFLPVYLKRYYVIQNGQFLFTSCFFKQFRFEKSLEKNVQENREKHYKKRDKNCEDKCREKKIVEKKS